MKTSCLSKSIKLVREQTETEDQVSEPQLHFLTVYSVPGIEEGVFQCVRNYHVFPLLSGDAEDKVKG